MIASLTRLPATPTIWTGGHRVGRVGEEEGAGAPTHEAAALGRELERAAKAVARERPGTARELERVRRDDLDGLEDGDRAVGVEREDVDGARGHAEDGDVRRVGGDRDGEAEEEDCGGGGGGGGGQARARAVVGAAAHAHSLSGSGMVAVSWQPASLRHFLYTNTLPDGEIDAGAELTIVSAGSEHRYDGAPRGHKLAQGTHRRQTRGRCGSQRS